MIIWGRVFHTVGPYCTPTARHCSGKARLGRNEQDLRWSLRMVVSSVSAVSGFPFCHFTVLPFWHYACSFPFPAFHLAVLARMPFRRLCVSVSGAALRAGQTQGQGQGQVRKTVCRGCFEHYVLIAGLWGPNEGSFLFEACFIWGFGYDFASYKFRTSLDWSYTKYIARGVKLNVCCLKLGVVCLNYSW